MTRHKGARNNPFLLASAGSESHLHTAMTRHALRETEDPGASHSARKKTT